SLTIDVKKPYTLQVPSAKSLSVPPAAPSSPAVDHFQCYKMKVTSGSAKFVTVSGVTAQDQFGTITVDVKKPKRFCAPVDKNGEAERHAHAHTHGDAGRAVRAAEPHSRGAELRRQAGGRPRHRLDGPIARPPRRRRRRGGGRAPLELRHQHVVADVRPVHDRR